MVCKQYTAGNTHDLMSSVITECKCVTLTARVCYVIV